MDRTSKRTRIIVSVILSLSLACNFFFAGWLAGSSLWSGPGGGPFGHEADFGPDAEGDRLPEMRFVGFLTRDMSEDGRRQVREALEGVRQQILDLKQRSDAIKQEAASLLRAEAPDEARITDEMEALEGVMQKRLSVVRTAITPVVAALDVDDRRVFASRWELGPGAPPPPPPR